MENKNENLDAIDWSKEIKNIKYNSAVIWIDEYTPYNPDKSSEYNDRFLTEYWNSIEEIKTKDEFNASMRAYREKWYDINNGTYREDPEENYKRRKEQGRLTLNEKTLEHLKWIKSLGWWKGTLMALLEISIGVALYPILFIIIGIPAIFWAAHDSK